MTIQLNSLLPGILISLAIGATAAGCDRKQQSDAAPVQSQAAAAVPTPNRSAAPVAMTPELKKDMADMYQKMADCLRTEKSLDQCSTDVMKDCPVMQKTGQCPIQQGMGAAMGGSMGEHARDSMGQMDGMGSHDMQEMPPPKTSE